MGNRTPLFEEHQNANAKIVDFGGWDMPLNYGSQIEEHHKVRSDAGMFDVSHMTVVDLRGDKVRDYLKHLLANNVNKLQTRGKALYSCMLNENGGVIDDLIVYFMDDDWFRMVVNAATREKDLAWLQKTADEFGGIELKERDDLAMIAVQGPNAKEKVFEALGEGLRDSAGALKPFHAVTVGELFVDRLHRRRRIRDYPAGQGRRLYLENAGRGRGRADRPRCARYPAPGGRDEPVRLRYG